MVQYLQDIINFLQGQQWAALLTVIGSGLAVSVAVELLKKLPKLEREAVIHFLVAALTVAATALQAIYVSGPQSLKVLGIYGAAIWSFSQIAYKLAVKPASNYIDKINVALNAQNAQASVAMSNAIDNPVPMTNLPGETTPQSASASNVADF